VFLVNFTRNPTVKVHVNIMPKISDDTSQYNSKVRMRKAEGTNSLITVERTLDTEEGRVTSHESNSAAYAGNKSSDGKTITRI